ncbi:DUF2690 domain-containing protein [Nonomuraea angiospora]|uniref:DUF2690 domain-containing protein n=1 Tax=Nonomuraea angiospora TaxID=46172 RepID=UPI00379A0EEF
MVKLSLRSCPRAGSLSNVARQRCREGGEEGPVLRDEPHPCADAESSFEDGDLVTQGENLNVLVFDLLKKFRQCALRHRPASLTSARVGSRKARRPNDGTTGRAMQSDKQARRHFMSYGITTSITRKMAAFGTSAALASGLLATGLMNGAAHAASLPVAGTAGPASAHPYDGQDPYRSGCAKSKVNTGKKASLKNEVGDHLGTIRLFYSRHCGTNWGEVSVATGSSGTITVYTSTKSRSFNYRPGNGGHHWGNMVHAPGGICAKAMGTVTAGAGRANKGSGTTAKACD